MSRSGSPHDLRRLDLATAHLDAPFAIVDMAAFRANAAAMTRRAGGKPIRLASKSVRCRHLIEQVLAMDGFRGILAYTLPEALWLAACDTSDDIVVAYPTADRAALARLAGDATAATSIALMVDCTEHLDLIEKATASVSHPHQVRVAIDIDAGYEALNGKFRAGARRSPVRTPADAVALAKAILSRPSLRLVGLMAYESQIAGVGDNPPGRPLYARAVRIMQRRSAAELAARRGAIVAGIRRLTSLEFVNGGGTGSLEGTSAEPAVTEIGAGSACITRRCSTPTAASPAFRRRCSRCPWCGDPALVSSPHSVAATRHPALARRAACRRRTCLAASGWTRRKALARYRLRSSARPRTVSGSGTRSGCGTPRRASCASDSASCT